MKPKPAVIPAMILFAVICCQTEAHAKKDTLLDFGVTYVGNHENDSSNRDTELQRTIYWASGKAGAPLGGGKYLMFAVDYVGQRFSYDNFEPTVFGGNLVRHRDLPDNLHALDFTFGLVWVSPQKKWITNAQFRPGLHSDFEDIDGDDVVYTGALLV